MPDPVTTEPVAPTTDPNLPEGFGNIGAELDKVFRSTAQKPVPAASSVPVAAPEASPVTTEPEPAPAPAKADDGFLPSDLFVESPKVETAPVVEEIPIPESLTKPKDIATWKELRHRLSEAETSSSSAKAEAAALKTRMEEIQPELLQSKLSETERINKELSDRIAVVDLQLHPEFQRQFEAPRVAAVQAAMELIKESEIDPAQFDTAMKLRGRARREALDEIVEEIKSPSLTGQLGVLFNQIEDLDRRKSGALSDAKGNWERLLEHDKTVRYEALQEEKKRLNSVIDQSEKRFADEHGIVFFKRSATNDQWNKEIEAETGVAKELATNCKDQGKICDAIRMGVAFPRVYNWALTVHKENQKLKAEMSDLKGAEPTLNGIGQGRSVSSEEDSKLTFAQRAARGSGLPGSF